MSKYAWSGNQQVAEVLEVHREGSKVEITFNVPTSFEGLAAAFYMDGSGSMQSAGNYGQTLQLQEPRRGLFAKLFEREQQMRPVQPNPVQDAMRVILPYIAGLDANGSCRAAYWATGSGQEVEVIGEFDVNTGAIAEFPGPNRFGGSTHLRPAVRDFVKYIQEQQASGETVAAALGVFVTDGQLHDAEAVAVYCREQLAPAIESGKFPTTSLVLIGVGPDINEEQLEELEESANPDEGYSGRELIHTASAESINELPSLVSHLVSATTPAFSGGATFVVQQGVDQQGVDLQGTVLATFEDVVPAVVEFEAPASVQTVVMRTPVGDLTISF